MRLICLELDSGSSPIHCSLSIACPGSETAPEYEAWPYCCGDQTDRFLITCNGHVIDMKLSANKKVLHDLDLVLQGSLFKDRGSLFWAQDRDLRSQHGFKGDSNNRTRNPNGGKWLWILSHI
jgi:hypothetical protein